MKNYLTRTCLGLFALLGFNQAKAQLTANPNTLLTYSTAIACTNTLAFCAGTSSGIPVTNTVEPYVRLIYLPEFNTSNHDSVLIKNVRFSNTIIRNFEAIAMPVTYTVNIYKVTGAGYTLANRTLLATAQSNTFNAPAGTGTLIGYSQSIYQQFSATFNKRISANDTLALEVVPPDNFNNNIWVMLYMGYRSESRQVSYVTAPLCGVYTTPTLVYPIVSAIFNPIAGCANIGFDIEANAEFFSVPTTPAFVQFKDTICAGAVNIPYSTTPRAHAQEYEWNYTGGGLTITPSGATANISASLTATSGFLRVRAKNYYGNSDWVSRFIVVDSIYRFNLNVVNPTICAGDSIDLIGPGGYASYRWEPPTGINSLNTQATKASPANSHSYTLVVEDQYGCRGIGSTFVSINPGPSIYYTPQPLSVCKDSITVNLSGATNYSWAPTTGLSNPVGNTTKARPAATTNYIITATDAMGCATKNPVTIIVTSPTQGVITQNGRILSANPGMVSYIWYKDDAPVVPTAIFDKYNVKTPGVYKVLMVDANGCEFFSNEIIVDNVTSIDRLSVDLVSIYPNPTKNNLTIKTDLDVNYELFSLDGKLLHKELNSKVVDMLQYAPGMYYLVIEDIASQQKASFKIVKSE